MCLARSVSGVPSTVEKGLLSGTTTQSSVESLRQLSWNRSPLAGLPLATSVATAGPFGPNVTAPARDRRVDLWPS